jgi:hypothetical protein
VDERLKRVPTIHRVKPVSEVLIVRLSRWQVVELPSGSRHAYGWNSEAHEGRASTMLAEFHPTTASLRSASGRYYQLVGPPGKDPDGEYVFKAWLFAHGLAPEAVESVSDEIWNAIQASRVGM